MKRIKSKLYSSLFLFLLISFTGNMSAQTDDKDTEEQEENVVDQDEKAELISDAKKAKTAFIENSPDLQELFDKAAGYVIFPNVGKGAYILGGAAGNGVLWEKGKLQGFAQLRQLDVGLQIGGQAFRQAIIFQTTKELNKFKKGKYKLSGNASAVILEEGGARNVEFSNGRAIVTMPKAGAMIEISVGGQKFDYRDKDY